MRNTNILRIVVITACILMVPYVGNAPWNLFDYLVAGGLLLGTGFAYEFVSRMGNRTYRFAVGIAVAAALMIVWGNLAVGFIGNEDHPANLMYGGVLAIGIIGAIIARFRAQGMGRALIATAVAQALVPVIALIIWRPPITLGVLKVFLFNGFFVALFVVSAFLFHRSAATPSKAA